MLGRILERGGLNDLEAIHDFVVLWCVGLETGDSVGGDLKRERLPLGGFKPGFAGGGDAQELADSGEVNDTGASLLRRVDSVGFSDDKVECLAV